jgi:hypothetical protein
MDDSLLKGVRSFLAIAVGTFFLKMLLPIIEFCSQRTDHKI